MSTTPTITAERLDQIEARDTILNGIEWVEVQKTDLTEIIALARLGLEHSLKSFEVAVPSDEWYDTKKLAEWAKEHGIPALRFYSEVRHPIHQEYEFKTEKAHEALAALPAAEQKGDE